MNKRIIISESERQSILNLHTLFKNKLNEQGLNFDNTGALKVPPTTTTTNTPQPLPLPPQTTPPPRTTTTNHHSQY